jgi:26S proteasome regulatory subunit N5
MSSGQVLKAEKDFTKEVDKLLPEAEELGKVGELLLLPLYS